MPSRNWPVREIPPSVRVVLVAAWTVGLFAVGHRWPVETVAVFLLVLTVAGAWWWRSLDRLVDGYVKRHDRRPRS